MTDGFPLWQILPRIFQAAQNSIHTVYRGQAAVFLFWFGGKNVWREQNDTQSRNCCHRRFLFNFFFCSETNERSERSMGSILPGVIVDVMKCKSIFAQWLVLKLYEWSYFRLYAHSICKRGYQPNWVGHSENLVGFVTFSSFANGPMSLLENWWWQLNLWLNRGGG